MRVLAVGNMYPPHHLGGYEVIWQGVMRHLRAEGHTARILTTDHRRGDVPAEASDESGVYRQLEWYWHDHTWRQMGPTARLRLERRNAWLLDFHLREFRPDLVTWWAVGGMSLSLIERVRRAGVPALFFVLDYWPSYGPKRDLWLRMWTRRPYAARWADRLSGIPTRVRPELCGRWVFCSRTIRDSTSDGGFDVSDSVILSAGVESSYLDARPEVNSPTWSWKLMYIGRVVEHKGVSTAIAALPLLPAGARLTILGEGDERYRAELETLAQRLGVADRVAFERPRPRSELIAAYRAADAIVFPVEWPEPWGLVPLEAMAVGRPVVATGTGGSGDYLAHEANALLFSPGDAEGLAAALNRLAQDPGLRDRLRRGGYNTASQHTESAFNEGALREMQTLLRRPKALHQRR